MRTAALTLAVIAFGGAAQAAPALEAGAAVYGRARLDRLALLAHELKLERLPAVVALRRRLGTDPLDPRMLALVGLELGPWSASLAPAGRGIALRVLVPVGQPPVLRTAVEALIAGGQSGLLPGPKRGGDTLAYLVAPPLAGVVRLVGEVLVLDVEAAGRPNGKAIEAAHPIVPKRAALALEPDAPLVVRAAGANLAKLLDALARLAGKQAGPELATAAREIKTLAKIFDGVAVIVDRGDTPQITTALSTRQPLPTPSPDAPTVAGLRGALAAPDQLPKLPAGTLVLQPDQIRVGLVPELVDLVELLADGGRRIEAGIERDGSTLRLTLRAPLGH